MDIDKEVMKRKSRKVQYMAGAIGIIFAFSILYNQKNYDPNITAVLFIIISVVVLLEKS